MDKKHNVLGVKIRNELKKNSPTLYSEDKTKIAAMIATGAFHEAMKIMDPEWKPYQSRV